MQPAGPNAEGSPTVGASRGASYTPCASGGEHFELAIPSDVTEIERVVDAVVARCQARDYPRRACALNVPVALTEALANAIVAGSEKPNPAGTPPNRPPKSNALGG